jgi:putative endonuclease
MNNRAIGTVAENRVIEYLQERGWIIIKKNFRFHRKEIDIIACRDDVLIFVEVKSRGGKDFGHGLEAVDRHKRERIGSVAHYFIEKNSFYDYNARFDVASIDGKELLYIEDAFRL